LPKGQPENKMTKGLWVVFFGKLTFWKLAKSTSYESFVVPFTMRAIWVRKAILGEMLNFLKVNLPKSQSMYKMTKRLLVMTWQVDFLEVDRFFLSPYHKSLGVRKANAAGSGVLAIKFCECK